MVDKLPDSQVLDYFETVMKDFLVGRLSRIKDWWDACIPPEIREDASQRHERAKKTNDVLNKPDYRAVDYINFDGYEKIISRKDNWRDHFEEVFLDKPIFEHKMRVILSLRNDIRHGRSLDEINSIRLRLHCYDVLSQIHETGQPVGAGKRADMVTKLGFRQD